MFCGSGYSHFKHRRDIHEKNNNSNFICDHFFDDYDQDEDDAILVIGFLFILIFYGAIAYTIFRITQTLSWRTPIRRFIKAYNLSKEELIREFSLAEKVAPSFWISQQYTFFVKDVEVKIIKNAEIEQCYQFTQINGKYRTFYVGLDTEQKKRYKSGAQKTTNDVQKVLQYYEANFPHIKIGKAIIKKY